MASYNRRPGKEVEGRVEKEKNEELSVMLWEQERDLFFLVLAAS